LKKLFLTALLLSTTAPTYAVGHDSRPATLNECLCAIALNNIEVLGELYAVHTLGSTNPSALKRSAVITAVTNTLTPLRDTTFGLAGIAIAAGLSKDLAHRTLDAIDKSGAKEKYTKLGVHEDLKKVEKDGCSSEDNPRLRVATGALLAGSRAISVANSVRSLSRDIHKFRNADAIAQANAESDHNLTREKRRQYLSLCVSHLLPTSIVLLGNHGVKCGRLQKRHAALINSVVELLGNIVEWNRRSRRYELELACLVDNEADTGRNEND